MRKAHYELVAKMLADIIDSTMAPQSANQSIAIAVKHLQADNVAFKPSRFRRFVRSQLKSIGYEHHEEIKET